MKNKALKAQFFICLFLLATPIQYILSHGTVTYPPSRVWNCFQEGPESPDSAPCEDAIIGWGTQAFYDWNEVARMDAGGMHQTIISDGNLASAGRPDKYGGLDQVRNDWVATNVTAGPLTVTWTNSVPHKTLYYRVYITKASWTPEQPLTWDSLELLVETGPRPSAATDNIDVILPERTGKHVIYSVWQRSLTPEAFYSTSDVDFGSVQVNLAPEAIFSSENGYCGGPSVEFSAADSYDPNGDDLTYSWDFGDGTTAEGVDVSHTYENLDTATVTLTVSDGVFSTGTSETIDLVRTPDCNELFCPFDAPRESALPSLNETYQYAYVKGTNGPDLSDMFKCSINWDLNNSGLYHFYYQTIDTYTSFLNIITHNFSETNPEVTFTGAEIERLDGSYFVTIDDDGNLVMVSKTGNFTIYFSKSEVEPDCGEILSTDDFGYDNALRIQNYPNPFTTTTTIEYTLDRQSPVSLKIFNLKGQLVKTIDNDLQRTGKHKVTVDLSNMNTGIYIYVIKTKTSTATKRMILKR